MRGYLEWSPEEAGCGRILGRRHRKTYNSHSILFNRKFLERCSTIVAAGVFLCLLQYALVVLDEVFDEFIHALYYSRKFCSKLDSFREAHCAEQPRCALRGPWLEWRAGDVSCGQCLSIRMWLVL